MFAANIPGATVLAIEPSPTTRGLLSRNIANNALVDRVRVIPVALADRSGTSNFFLTSDDAYDSLLDSKRRRVRSVIKVEVATLDDLPQVREAGVVGLIKIAVEGLEAAVIRGAARTIDKDRPLIMAEIYRGTASNPDPEGTVREIVTLGYYPYALTGSGLRPFTSHNDKNYNYFFVPMRPPCRSSD
jgi:FkbM family methyltransferase